MEIREFREIVMEQYDKKLPKYEAQISSDIEKYNEVARRVLEARGVIINDLYKISAAFDNSLHADWVHFNEEGSKILAQAVSKIIGENYVER